MGLGIIAFALFTFNACNSKESIEEPADQMQEFSLQFDAASILDDTKALVPVPGYSLCGVPENTPLSVDVTILKDGSLVPITLSGLSLSMYGSNLKTEPQFLASGDYTIQSVSVYNGSTVYYAGVLVGAPLAQFIPANPIAAQVSYLMGSQRFKLENYTKPTIILYVLCAQHQRATDFGMPKFQINRMEVTCLDIFFNVCDGNGEHQVGTGTITTYDKDPRQGGKVLKTDIFGSGNIGTFCFANDLTKDDASETYYLVITLTNYGGNQTRTFGATVNVADLLDYKEFSNWDANMNALHAVVDCDGIQTFCILSVEDNSNVRGYRCHTECAPL